jgi:hypothetical protein
VEGTAHMSLDEMMQLARSVFGDDTDVLTAKWGEDANAVFLLRDEYGKYAVEVKGAGHLLPEEVQKSLEGHRRYRGEKIAEWDLQRKWGKEIADLVTGSVPDGPERKLDWLPKLMLERFDNDFDHDMPQLRAYVSEPSSVDPNELASELTQLPKTWTKPWEQ